MREALTKVSCITETSGCIIKIGSNFVHVASVTIRVNFSTKRYKIDYHFQELKN